MHLLVAHEGCTKAEEALWELSRASSWEKKEIPTHWKEDTLRKAVKQLFTKLQNEGWNPPKLFWILLSAEEQDKLVMDVFHHFGTAMSVPQKDKLLSILACYLPRPNEDEDCDEAARWQLKMERVRTDAPFSMFGNTAQLFAYAIRYEYK